MQNDRVAREERITSEANKVYCSNLVGRKDALVVLLARFFLQAEKRYSLVGFSHSVAGRLLFCIQLSAKDAPTT